MTTSVAGSAMMMVDLMLWHIRWPRKVRLWLTCQRDRASSCSRIGPSRLGGRGVRPGFAALGLQIVLNLFPTTWHGTVRLTFSFYWLRRRNGRRVRVVDRRFGWYTRIWFSFPFDLRRDIWRRDVLPMDTGFFSARRWAGFINAGFVSWRYWGGLPVA